MNYTPLFKPIRLIAPAPVDLNKTCKDLDTSQITQDLDTIRSALNNYYEQYDPSSAFLIQKKLIFLLSHSHLCNIKKATISLLLLLIEKYSSGPIPLDSRIFTQISKPKPYECNNLLIHRARSILQTLTMPEPELLESIRNQLVGCLQIVILSNLKITALVLFDELVKNSNNPDIAVIVDIIITNKIWPKQERRLLKTKYSHLCMVESPQLSS